MSDLPRQVDIAEEGPREGFQVEKNPIPSADKIALIDALSATGLRHIQVASFVSPKLVPGWADAEQVVAGFTPKPDIHYTALWFNAAGLDRALAFKDRLHLFGSISLAASEAFSLKNLNRDRAGQIEAMRKQTAAHIAAGVPVTRIGLQAAFGCNYAGDVPPAQVMAAVTDGLMIAAEAGVTIQDLTLADTMGWANPRQIEAVVGEVRNRWPELRLALHLHDTRGLGIANAMAGLRMGVARFDAAVGGLGGCPFAGQPGAPGNIATEELALLCAELGIATGIDLEALVEAGRLAERILDRRLPSAVLRGGTLARFRAQAAWINVRRCAPLCTSSRPQQGRHHGSLGAPFARNRFGAGNRERFRRTRAAFRRTFPGTDLSADRPRRGGPCQHRGLARRSAACQSSAALGAGCDG
jgi:hydroxymethylglutaryl-CoA lyase